MGVVRDPINAFAPHLPVAPSDAERRSVTCRTASALRPRRRRGEGRHGRSPRVTRSARSAGHVPRVIAVRVLLGYPTVLILHYELNAHRLCQRTSGIYRLRLPIVSRPRRRVALNLHRPRVTLWGCTSTSPFAITCSSSEVGTSISRKYPRLPGETHAARLGRRQVRGGRRGASPAR